MSIADLAGFLLDHADLLELVMSALKAGTPKEALMDSVKAAMVAASDAEMRREFPNG